MESYEDLNIFWKTYQLGSKVYKYTEQFLEEGYYRLAPQLKRTIVSFFLLSFATTFLLLSFSSSLYAMVIDEYSSTFSVTTLTDTGASASVSAASGIDGGAVRLDYSMGTGSWALFSKDYTSRDFASEGGNAIRFRYAANNYANFLEVKFTDYDSTDSSKCDKFDLKIPIVPDSQWRTMNVVFSSFSLFPDGNSSFELSKVSRMMFGTVLNVGTRGSGTVWIDQVELYKSTYTLVDDFNDGDDPNYFGGATLAFGGTPNATKQYLPDGTNKVMKFTYSVPNADEYAYLTIGLSTRNFQGYTHLYFKVRRDLGGGEWIKVKLETPLANSAEVFISTYLTGGITTSYQDVFIPMSAFTGVSVSSVTRITLVTGNSFGSGAGMIYIDDLAFVRRNETPGVVRVLDDMDTDYASSNWESYRHDDATIQISMKSDATVPDAKANNRVYALDYNFTLTPSKPSETPWAVIERPLQISLAPFSALSFRYNGTGSSNNIEFKLTDNDNTIWYKKFLSASDTGGVWKTVTFPIDELVYFSAGTDADLNLKRIKQVSYAFSKGTGGSGAFTVDSVEAPESGDFSTISPGRLISSFRIVNNPFSPNGDGIKEEAFFVYNLQSTSKVNLRIYSLEGGEIKTVVVTTQSSGEQSLSWDGRDNGNAIVRNGLYIYRLEAEGADGRTDVIRQVVAVLR